VTRRTLEAAHDPPDVRLGRRASLARLSLAVKLALALIGLVALVLVVNGAIEAWLGYEQTKRAALEVQSEKAQAAAARVEEFLGDIEAQLGWTTGAEWGYGKAEQQRYDLIRLLREEPAIASLAYIDGHGKEQLAVSRLDLDSIASGKDYSSDPRFVRAVADKVWFGPVEFRGGSEPHMAIAIAHVGKTPGVTVADVNLEVIWDVISAIRVGDRGFAYVVDDKGRLIADPDLSLVLRETDLSGLPQVRAALAALGSGRVANDAAPPGGSAEIARGRDGGDVLTAYAIAWKPRWVVFAQQPLGEAFAHVTQSLLRTAALLGLGLLLALVSGAALARRMTAPIRALQKGAERLGGGELGQRIDVRTGDEIEALAGSFNRMAGRLRESYETLEARVEARTRDLNEALRRQTATSDILRAIAASPSDMGPALAMLAETVCRLCQAHDSVIMLREGERLRILAHHGPVPLPPNAGGPVSRDWPPGRAVVDGNALQVVDLLAEEAEYPRAFAMAVEAQRAEGDAAATGLAWRSVLVMPLMRDGSALGVIALRRKEVSRFSDAQAAMLATFADQAAIAIENARLFDEVQAKTLDLEESLAQQTATAEVLQSISRSVFDLDTVLRTLIDTAVGLCRGSRGTIFIRNGDRIEARAFHSNVPHGLRDYILAHPVPLDGGEAIAATIRDGRIVHYPDLVSDPSLVPAGAREQAAFGALLCVPLLREGEAIGCFAVPRNDPVAFTEREIDLVRTFADQAVIAIENARLFAEVQAKTQDLAEALQMQTATSDALKVISRSAFDLQAVFSTLVSSAVALGGARTGAICVRDGDVFRYRDAIGAGQASALAGYLKDHPATPGRSTIAGRVLLSGKVERIPDCLADPDYVVPMGALASNVRSLLGAPLVAKDRVEGAIILTRDTPGHFSDRQVEIVQTFADQAVIALENVRLFDEVQARTKELAASLDDLRKAQDRLIQTEKLASLGQLTAGIAHEIKNPLNFINNFSALSRELMGELRAVLDKAPLADADREEAGDLIGMIDGNLDKVVSHGRRADSIVKNMLLHSRDGSGERGAVNVNAMVEEALNLAYHGARAEKPGFNVTIEKSLDPAAGEADLYPQEMTRVLLNLISNGFYATEKRKQSETAAGWEPTITASTRDLGASVEIVIRDNGAGVPDDVKAKLFNPFFTTKPAGEGTGLGLSLSHDIVVKQHGGAIDVATEPGAWTAFILTLPRGGTLP